MAVSDLDHSSLTVIQSMSAPLANLSYKKCFEIWSQLSEAFDRHNLSLSYDYDPADLGKVLTFTVLEVNQSEQCLVERLPFKPIAFTFLLTVIAVSFIGNAAIFLSLYTNRKKWSKVNFFILHLSIADMIVLLTPVVEVVNIVTQTWYGGRHLCKLYRVLSTFGLYLSSFIVVSLAVDRYVVIIRPLSIANASRRGKALLIASLVTSLVCSLPQAFVFDTYESSFFKSYNLMCMETYATMDDSSFQRYLYTIFAFAMMYGLPLIVITWCYGRILCVLTVKSNEHRGSSSQTTPSQAASANESIDSTATQNTRRVSSMQGIHAVRQQQQCKISLRRNDVRNIERARMCTLKMTVIIVLGFLLCWAPHWIVTLMNTLNAADNGAFDPDIVYMCLTFAFVNSGLNPLIYGLFSQQCRAFCASLCPARCRSCCLMTGDSAAAGALRTPGAAGITGCTSHQYHHHHHQQQQQQLLSRHSAAAAAAGGAPPSSHMLHSQHASCNDEEASHLLIPMQSLRGNAAPADVEV